VLFIRIASAWDWISWSAKKSAITLPHSQYVKDARERPKIGAQAQIDAKADKAVCPVQSLLI